VLHVVGRTSATHKLGLHDIVEESFEKLKNSDSHGAYESTGGTSKIPCPSRPCLFKLEFHGTDTDMGTDTDIRDAPIV